MSDTDVARPAPRMTLPQVRGFLEALAQANPAPETE